MKCLEHSFLSDRVAMFTQTVGMTASDWPVSRVVKRSQTIEILLFFNFYYLLQKLPLADRFCGQKQWSYALMRTSKPHWVEKIVQNMWELKRSRWITRRRHRLRQRNA